MWAWIVFSMYVDQWQVPADRWRQYMLSGYTILSVVSLVGHSVCTQICGFIGFSYGPLIPESLTVYSCPWREWTGNKHRLCTCNYPYTDIDYVLHEEKSNNQEEGWKFMSRTETAEVWRKSEPDKPVHLIKVFSSVLVSAHVHVWVMSSNVSWQRNNSTARRT